MKRGLVILAVAFFILFSLIIALISTNLIYAQDNSLKQQQALDLELKTQRFLIQPVEIPDSLKVVVRIVFGLKADENLDTQTLMVMVAIWIGLFTIIAAVLEFLPFLNKGFSRWLGAVIVTCLIGVSGGIKTSAIFLLSLTSGIIDFFVAIAIVVGIVFCANIILNKILAKAKLEQMEIKGLKAGAVTKIQENRFNLGSGI